MRVTTVLTTVLLLGLVGFAVKEARAEKATQEEARLVCQNWLAYTVYQEGGWAGEAQPKIVNVQLLVSGDVVLAYCFSITPSGYVVVPVLKELPAVKAYSEEYGLNVNQTVGFPQLLRDVLENRVNLYIEAYGSLDASQPPTGDVLLGRGHRRVWDRLLVDRGRFKDDLDAGGVRGRDEVGPLLSTAWHQSWPYNVYCPTGDQGCVHCPDGRDPTLPTLVGCTATAMAQILKYHDWPPLGTGDYKYDWAGDHSCNAPGPPYPGASEISVEFGDPYDWGNMPNNCPPNCSPAEVAALAELCYEVGAAFDMDYGVCCSGAWLDPAITVLPAHFCYDPAITREDRKHYEQPGEWFDMIVNEINAYRPMLYSIGSHCVVCDGWRVVEPLYQWEYHINYGWGDGHTTWYVMDQIYDTGGINEEHLIRGIMPGQCLLVGACCLPGGDCIHTTWDDCLYHNGTYAGDVCLGDNNGNGIDDACEDADGACCLTDGSCVNETLAECQMDGGDFKGVGTGCRGDADYDGVDDICTMTRPVPALTGWGLAALTLLLVVAGITVMRRSKVQAG